MKPAIRLGRWQAAILLSFLCYEIGVYAGAWFDHQSFVFALSIVFLVLSVVLLMFIRAHKGWMLFGGVVLVSLSAGFATQSIWLDKDALTVWVPDLLRLGYYGGVLLLWTTMVRWLPWKKVWSVLAIADFVFVIILGIVLYRFADFAKEILYLGIFYLPVALGTLVILFVGKEMEDHLLASFFGALLVIVLIAVIVLSQGDFIGDLDFGFGKGKRLKRSKR